jgi:uncharacterized iron-regulated membrane protein
VRRALFWMHLAAGVLISALVLFFSVTGCLLAWERPILHAMEQREYAPATAAQGSARMPLDSLLPIAATTLPTAMQTITVHPDPASPVELETADHSLYFADAFTGAVHGPVSPRARAFFAEVTALHRWFGLANAKHSAAILVKGITVLLFSFLLISGAILWLPKTWTPATLRTGIVPRFDVTGRARNYNWHKSTGFWLVLPLSVVVVTGIIMAFPWANALLFRLARSPLPQRRVPGANAQAHGAAQLPPHLDEAFALATSGVAHWQTASLRLSLGPPGLQITVDRGDGGQPQKREQVTINPTTLAVLHREPFAAESRGQQWRSWVRFAHTGEAGGWWGETLAFITACGAIVLSLTGILLSLGRLERWRGRQPRRNTIHGPDRYQHPPPTPPCHPSATLRSGRDDKGG